MVARGVKNVASGCVSESVKIEYIYAMYNTGIVVRCQHSRHRLTSKTQDPLLQIFIKTCHMSTISDMGGTCMGRVAVLWSLRVRPFFAVD